MKNPCSNPAHKLNNPRRSYQIRIEDLGKESVHGAWFEPLGRVLAQDVGKMVYEVSPGVWQVESWDQFRKRTGKNPFKRNQDYMAWFNGTTYTLAMYANPGWNIFRVPLFLTGYYGLTAAPEFVGNFLAFNEKPEWGKRISVKKVPSDYWNKAKALLLTAGGRGAKLPRLNPPTAKQAEWLWKQAKDSHKESQLFPEGSQARTFRKGEAVGYLMSRELMPNPRGEQYGDFSSIRPGDTVRFMQYAGGGSRRPEFRPAQGRAMLLAPGGWVVHITGSSGARPGMVTPQNFVAIARKGPGVKDRRFMNPLTTEEVRLLRRQAIWLERLAREYRKVSPISKKQEAIIATTEAATLRKVAYDHAQPSMKTQIESFKALRGMKPWTYVSNPALSRADIASLVKTAAKIAPKNKARQRQLVEAYLAGTSGMLPVKGRGARAKNPLLLSVNPPVGAMPDEMKKAAEAYQKFHGVPPTTCKVVNIPDGKKAVTKMGVFWSMGTAPDRTYRVPAGSKKAKVAKEFVHKYKTQPEVVSDANGRIIMDIPKSAKTQITMKPGDEFSWMRG